MSETFLTGQELRDLTGRCRKSCQVKQLRKMGIPFYLTASGRPVVLRSAIEGRFTNSEDRLHSIWSPRLLKL